MERLSSIAATQPHAAYATFIHGLISKWTYLVRTTPDIEDLLQPLENAIRQQLLPSLTGQTAFNDLDRDLLALPTCLGGLGIINFSCQATAHNRASKRSAMRIFLTYGFLINPFAHSYPDTSLPQWCRWNEMEKRRAYDERVREVKHGSFSPLVFSTTGCSPPPEAWLPHQLSCTSVSLP